MERNEYIERIGVMGLHEHGERFAQYAIDYLAGVMNNPENEVSEQNPFQFAWRTDGHLCCVEATPNRITLNIQSSK